MCGASEFKLSSQQQSCLTYAMEPSPEQQGYWADIHSNYKSTSCFPAQIAHSRLSFFFFFFPLSLSFSRPHLPAAKDFGSSEVNLFWINNHHYRRMQFRSGFWTVLSNTKAFSQQLWNIWLQLTVYIKTNLSRAITWINLHFRVMFTPPQRVISNYWWHIYHHCGKRKHWPRTENISDSDLHQLQLIPTRYISHN